MSIAILLQLFALTNHLFDGGLHSAAVLLSVVASAKRHGHARPVSLPPRLVNPPPLPASERRRVRPPARPVATVDTHQTPLPHVLNQTNSPHAFPTVNLYVSRKRIASGAALRVFRRGSRIRECAHINPWQSIKYNSGY